MSWESSIARWQRKYKKRTKLIFVRSAQIAFESIKEGSSITGAPGQPIDDAILIRSWTLKMEGPFEALVSTPVLYAPGIENAMGPRGPIQLRSSVGGFHSVKLTKAAWTKIVATAVREIVGV